MRRNAYERTKTPNGPVNARTLPIDFGRSKSRAKLPSSFRIDGGHGQIRLEDVAHGDRPAARAAAAVGLRERLVEVDVDDVEAHVARPRDPADGVEVRAVVVHEGSRSVEDPLDLLDVLVEQAERRRVGRASDRRSAADLAP